jgi:hypothetical protein
MMDPDDTGAEHAWSARTVQPIVAVYVAAVFVCFMGLAHFVFHSADAVKALFAAAVAGVAAVVPAILNRVEYRISGTGLAKRPLRRKGPGAFEDVFAWDELTHLVPTGTGFKYYKTLPDTGAVSRFFKLYLSAEYSGEFHVDPEDRARVRAIFDRRGVPTSKPPTRGALRRP